MMKSRLTVLALACMTVVAAHAQIAPAGSLADAAQKVVAAVKGSK